MLAAAWNFPIPTFPGDKTPRTGTLRLLLRAALACRRLFWRTYQRSKKIVPSIRRDCLLAQRRAINGNVSVHLGPAGIVACRSDESRGNRTYSLVEKEPIPNCYSSFWGQIGNFFFFRLDDWSRTSLINQFKYQILD